MKRKGLWAGLWVFLLLLSAPAAFAQESGDKLVVGQNYVLSAGEQLDGNLAVLGGNATLEARSTVTGDVAVFGGNLRVDGAVRGSIAVFGGAVSLGELAVVEGDLAAFGGAVNAAPGAVIRGDSFGGPRLPPAPLTPRAPAAPDEPGGAAGSFLRGLLLWQLSTAGWSMLLALLGVAAVAVAPRGMARLATAAASDTALSCGMGLLTLVVGVLSGAVLLIACGFGLLVWLLLALALFVGWLAVGLWVGQRVLQMLRLRQASSLAEVAVGVFLITLLSRLPFCIGFLCWLIFSAIGLGAVVLTRFGTQTASRPAPTSGSAGYLEAPAASSDVATDSDDWVITAPAEQQAPAAPVVIVLPAVPSQLPAPELGDRSPDPGAPAVADPGDDPETSRG